MVTVWRPARPRVPTRNDGKVRDTPRAASLVEMEGGAAVAATVLVVEDERKLRDLVRSYLERAGFIVLSTGSGAEAITMAASAAPDLVVLDLGLPDVPGEAVARALRDTSGTPIL